ncbi:hypothetical protein [Rhodoblastus sp.]|uniref:hypothetical protein n=1 Tax=Rhodoblastus sp. TaxID=1962975 RepID=UPI003F989B6C
MFFLFRCLFWLGLVFSRIAGQEGFNAAALFDQRAPIASESAASLGRLALDAAGRQCRAEPEKCLALAARASRLAPPPASPNASHDTLSAGDRAPAWRLRPSAAPDSDRHG